VQKETDFMRLCHPSQLHIGDMLTLLIEDNQRYMSDWEIRNTVRSFLREADIPYKAFLALKELLQSAAAKRYDNRRATAHEGENTEVGTHFLCLLRMFFLIPYYGEKGHFAKLTQKKNAAIRNTQTAVDFFSLVCYNIYCVC
jgi:hypothetical protein